MVLTGNMYPQTTARNFMNKVRNRVRSTNLKAVKLATEVEAINLEDLESFVKEEQHAR